MKTKILKESKAEYLQFMVSEEGFRILQAAGYGGNMEKIRKKASMDLSDTPFEVIADAVKGMKLDFPIFSEEEIQRIKEIKRRKKNSGKA